MSTNNLAGFLSQKTPEGIYKFTIRDMKPTSVDAWFETLMDIEEELIPHDGHMRCVYIMHGIWPSPYAIKRVLEASRRAHETLKASSAVVLVNTPGIAIRIVQSLLRQMPVYALQSRQIFFNEGDAMRRLHARHAAFTVKSPASVEQNERI
jgi:hypothetical protein